MAKKARRFVFSCNELGYLKTQYFELYIRYISFINKRGVYKGIFLYEMEINLTRGFISKETYNILMQFQNSRLIK